MFTPLRSPSFVWLLLSIALLLSCQKLEDSLANSRPSSVADLKKEESRGAPESAGEAEKSEGEAGGPRGWQRSVLDTHRVRIEVGDEQTLPVDALAVQVHVDGFRARVVLDVDFHNPEGWRLEGSFALRLPEGASPYFLAFGGRVETAKLPPAGPLESLTPANILAAREQVWSKPAELEVAHMVERDRAKIAYRNTVRRNVDPALSEWAGAGVFNTKLFPIEPNANHRVVIGYDVDLLEASDGLSLPIIVPEDAATRSLQLTVVAGAGVEASLVRVAAEAGDDAAVIAPEPRDRQGRLRYRLSNPPAQLELSLRGDTNVALLGGEAATGRYFAARLAPKLPKSKAAKQARRAVFALDVSMSSNPDKFNVWLDVLKATLELNRDSLHEFAVLAFNVEQFWWQPSFVANTPEQLDALMTHVQTLALEGATDLDTALREAVRPAWLGPDAGAPDWDVFLLSDGAASWGEPDGERVLRQLRAEFPGRVFGYRTGLAGTELTVLDRLAAETGGAVFAVTGPDQVAAAATAHRVTPWQLVSLTAPGLDDLLVAGAPRFVYPGQILTLAARVRPDAGEQYDTLALTVAQAGREQVVKLRPASVIESELAPRVYGQLATTALERFHGFVGQGQDGAQVGVESLAYARHFRVTGKAASLLMLGAEQDYEREDIDWVEQANIDAARVMATAVGPQLERAEQVLAAQLGDPRAAMLAMLARVRELSSPDARLDVATQHAAFEQVGAFVRRLPDASFEVAVPRLACARHDRAAIDAPILAQLAAREPIYDELVQAAEQRRRQVGPADAVKAISSLVEANPGDTVMARDVAFMAREWGQGAQVYQLLRRVALTRPEEPQTYLALGALAAELGAADLAMVYFELALSGGWEARFGDVRQIAAVEYLRFLGQVSATQLAEPQLAASRRDQLAQHLPVRTADLLVIMTWNTDNTDIDLHVLEPSGEDCYYGNRHTKAGGEMSTDVTQGFGPEMYFIEHAPRGSYRIRAHYFASDRSRLATRTKAYVTVFEGFGTAQERVTTKVVALADDRSEHDILTIER